MKKTGFTLAEVLITFAIVGIVAAITLPGLNNGVNKSKVGPALAKAFNTLETANKVALLERDVVALDSIDVKKSRNDQNCTERYAADYANQDLAGKCKYIRGNYLEKIALQLSGHTTVVGGVKNENSFTLKDGTEYILHSSFKSHTPHDLDKTADHKYRYKCYALHIDINGSKTPNANGQDRFLVFVDTGGTVIAAGSKEAKRYFAGSTNNTYVTKYGQEKDCTDPSERINDYCTGTILRDGWTVNW